MLVKNETNEKKIRKKQKHKVINMLLTSLVILITFAVLVNIVMGIRQSEYQSQIVERETITASFSQKSVLTDQKCPSAVAGNNESFLHIKYFYSDYCPWCRKEESVFKSLLAEYGELFYLEWYKVADCEELADQYKVNGVPTFVFSTTDEDQEFSQYGYIQEKDFKKLICDVNGVC